MLEPGESTEELVYGEEPANNGDYTWCEVCHAYVNFDYVKETEQGEYMHRDHKV